ncbi:MAG: tRNA wybutosine-synthesizing protein 1 [Candidatus Woesearchaeota archaeon]|jgi:tRNA wybutosine-synthesizing protein 1
MLSETGKKQLEKQHYKLIGTHSAVKTCYWTKAHIRGEGGCYKLTFYGIMSNQCMQMTTSMSCANRCTFCWRGYKAPVSKEWKWDVDDPRMILDESLAAHELLLNGFGGNPYTVPQMYEKSKTVKHVALSLTGEPITYPRMNEMIDMFHEKGISTFLVSNAQYDEQIKSLHPVTQLYLSIDAPNRPLLKEIDVPLFEDFWERTLRSLDALKEKKHRTCIRLTHIQNYNDVDDEGYAELIHRGDPDFIEVKAYMFVGASQDRTLSMANMPNHEDVVSYSKRLLKVLPEYDIVSEHVASRAVMFAKKDKFFIDGVWNTWIDFVKFAELYNSGAQIRTEDFMLPTPKTGLSGRTTKEHVTLKSTFKTKRKERAIEQGRIIGTA